MACANERLIRAPMGAPELARRLPRVLFERVTKGGQVGESAFHRDLLDGGGGGGHPLLGHAQPLLDQHLMGRNFQMLSEFGLEMHRRPPALIGQIAQTQGPSKVAFNPRYCCGHRGRGISINLSI